ncbi:MAG: TonB-dependent receptor [Pseudomonadota bacterium]
MSQRSMLLIPSILLAALNPSHAVGANEDDASVLDPVQVRGERNLEAELAGSQALTTIGREALDDQMALGVVDWFRGQPGVFVQQTTPGQGIPIVRGLKGSEVLHLVDGFRINNALFRNAPNQYLALIDPNAIGSVDLVRGPPGTLFGSDAMGGVIQLVSLDPRQQPAFTFKGRARSNDPELMGHAAFGLQSADWAARIGLTTQQVGDRRTGSGQDLPSDYRSQAADASWQWSLSPGHSLRALVQYLNQPRTARVDRLVPGFGETEPQSAQADFAPNRRAFGLMRYDWQPVSTWVDSLTAQIGRQVVRDDRETVPFDSERLTLESNRSTLDGLRVFASTRRPGHVWHFGLDAYRDEVNSTRQRGEPGALQAIDGRFPDGSRQDNQDLFLAHRWTLAESLRLHWGARYSRSRLDLPARGDDPSLDLDNAAWSGDLGLNWRLNTSTSLLFKASRGFRAPNIFDVANLGERPGNRFSIPNPDLEPEFVESLELGLRWRQGDWSGEAFVFESDYDDRITSVLTGAVDAEGRAIVQSQNAASARFRGVESWLRWQPPSLWSVQVTGNWIRGDEELPGQDSEPADRVPPLNGQLQISWQPDLVWTLGTRLTAAAGQSRLNSRDIRDPRIDPDGTPGWTDLGLFGRWQPDLAWDVRVRLDNLLDRAYREHGSGVDRPGRSVAIEVSWTPR